MLGDTPSLGTWVSALVRDAGKTNSAPPEVCFFLHGVGNWKHTRKMLRFQWVLRADWPPSKPSWVKRECLHRFQVKGQQWGREIRPGAGQRMKPFIQPPHPPTPLNPEQPIQACPSTHRGDVPRFPLETMDKRGPWSKIGLSPDPHPKQEGFLSTHQCGCCCAPPLLGGLNRLLLAPRRISLASLTLSWRSIRSTAMKRSSWLGGRR